MQKDDDEKEEAVQYAQNVHIIPKIYYDDFQKRMKVDFKIGEGLARLLYKNASSRSLSVWSKIKFYS